MSGKQLARRWADKVWNQRDVAAISRLFAHDGVMHGLGPNGQDLIGPDRKCRPGRSLEEMTIELDRVRQKYCSKCGQPFDCCAGGCWCDNVHLSDTTRAILREQYSDCLCAPCLAAFNRSAKRIGEPRST